MTTSPPAGRWLIASMGAAGRRGPLPRRKPDPHNFRDDATGTETCACGLPRRNARHDMPDTPAGAQAVDARVNGEHETE